MVQNRTVEVSSDEIDIKDIFRTLFRYKLMIIGITFVFSVFAAYYAYFQHNIYEATATVEIGDEKKGLGDSDILNMAMDAEGSDIDTEMLIAKSRFVVAKAMESVEMTKHIFSKQGFKQIEEYYPSLPFEVALLKGYGTVFQISPIDEKTYRLIVEKSKDENDKEWSYDAIHSYGEEISNDYFHLNIVEKNNLKIEKEYRIVVNNKEKTISSILENLNVVQLQKSNIFSISFQDTVKERSEAFVNAVAQAYLSQSVENKTIEQVQKLSFIDEQMEKITTNLRDSEIKLQDFKKSANTVSLSSKGEDLMRQIATLDTQLTDVSMEEEILVLLNTKIKKGKHLESLSTAGLGDYSKALETLIVQMKDVVIKKKLLTEDYTDMHPIVKKLNFEIEETKKILTESIANLLRAIQQKKKLIQQSLDKKQERLNTLPTDERVFAELQRKFEVNEKIYSYLLEKRSESAILKASTVSQNRIIDVAITPDKPIKPKRKLIFVVGVILGLVIGIVLAFVRSVMDNRIKSIEDLRLDQQNITLYGSIPHVKEMQDDMKIFTSPKSVFTEAFRNLRINLQYAPTKSATQIIAVTSTVGGEGKTTTCMNLGSIMSIAGKKTIIVDLDMRKPTLHKRFNVDLEKGISGVLAGYATTKEVIQATKYDNLDVITSGAVPPNPGELLQSGKIIEVVGFLKAHYDVIILDTPPVGLVSDARTVFPLAHIVLYVVRINYSKKEYLDAIVSLANSKETFSFGVLVNDISRGGYGYGYGYGYYEEEK